MMLHKHLNPFSIAKHPSCRGASSYLKKIQYCQAFTLSEKNWSRFDDSVKDCFQFFFGGDLSPDDLATNLLLFEALESCAVVLVASKGMVGLKGAMRWGDLTRFMIMALKGENENIVFAVVLRLMAVHLVSLQKKMGQNWETSC